VVLQAEKILRKQLDNDPTPDLWCVLGGLTKDEECFHKAWSMSRGSCARAMRDLARVEMARGDVDNAITHMRAALDLNPLRPQDWFFLGMASKKAERCVHYHNMFLGRGSDIELHCVRRLSTRVDRHLPWTVSSTSYRSSRTQQKPGVISEDFMDSWVIFPRPLELWRKPPNSGAFAGIATAMYHSFSIDSVFLPQATKLACVGQSSVVRSAQWRLQQVYHRIESPARLA